jgi:hypothetical protein
VTVVVTEVDAEAEWPWFAPVTVASPVTLTENAWPWSAEALPEAVAGWAVTRLPKVEAPLWNPSTAEMVLAV